MYLKRLELRGFKTFASYTEFLFDAGITAVVGPNGSGKSNIADAVRWVLGEQSYTALRGKRTEDMIFAGTSRRPQQGLAEAIITLDNDSHWLPIDFSEVTVARRAYRSGENQYFVNGSRVRLRDVVELLGKAGLGRQGFVVIGQGVVDAALTLRPEERRILFEEAAGIHVYQDKRRDALSKLAETQQNLLRLNDILNEIAPRLHDLERQAKRAEEYRLLSRDLENLLRIWYGYQWQRLQASLSEAEVSVQRRLGDLDLGRAKIGEVEAVLGSTRARQGDLRRQLSLWHKDSSELHAQAEATARELAVSRERLLLLQQRRSELQNELAQLQAQRSSLEEIVAAAQAETVRLQEEIQQLATRALDLRQQWQDSDTERQESEQAVESARTKSFHLATTLADARNRSRQLVERKAQLIAELEKQQREQAATEDQLPALEGEISQLRKQDQDLVVAQEQWAAQLKQSQGQLATLEEDLEHGREELALAARQRQRLEDRQEMLQGLRQSLAGLAPGVKAVLESRDKLSGIVGPVSSLLQVSEKLERAIEAALASYGQALVVERWDDASAAIAHLRQEGAGWATFLPLDSLTPSQVFPAPAGAGVLGVAQDLVQSDGRYHKVLQLLLGRVVVVEDLETARRARQHLQPGQRLVTLLGEVVQATGVVSGGSGRKQSSVLAQEREWRELPSQVSAAQHAEEQARAALREAENKHKKCRQDLAAANEQRERSRQEREVLLRSVNKQQQKWEGLQQEIEWRRRLDGQQERESRALDERASAVQREVESQGLQHQESKATLDQALATLEKARQREQTARDLLSQADTRLAVAQRQVHNQEQLRTSQAASRRRLEDETTAKSGRAGELQQESATLATRVQEQQTKADSLSARLTQITAQIEPAEAEVVALDSQMLGLDKDLAQARQRLGELEVLHSQQMLEKERRADALHSLEQRIEEELGDIEYPSERVQQLRLEFFRADQPVLFPTPVVSEDLEAEIRDLKGRMRRLGSINPNAPQEHQEVRLRHEFLQSQITDLQTSAASLQQVVKELDQVMEREFLSIFSVAAKEFSTYFETLFGGGQARLFLTDPESPSTTGVEIIARPPGKRQQSLALLSGGERALTATALLFAVLKARPLPFCLLDEVDAMLDEANVGRFRALLEEFAASTQFIVITHNRHTVEAAKTIYGISMAEEGISKVVSLRLEEAPAATP